ncbi:expressed unknown protein [Seminavis robusta]|uniref:Uncharacterized protein n=1 Tax=Seminavis robusta TaxID=568900 RepID=A0A9N8HL35_9STRA|nr:expressed unknown protein [Seminavis robusta]|eukprot:Sro996_g229260.1 n/a (160) ;mRNA; r:13545-14024
MSCNEQRDAAPSDDHQDAGLSSLLCCPSFDCGGQQCCRMDAIKAQNSQRDLALRSQALPPSLLWQLTPPLLHVLQAQQDEGNGNDSSSLPTEEDDGWGDVSDVPEPPQPAAVQSAEEPERDLFIPIFTLVSVVGFGGLYAYETLRLYLNGELYLPGGGN